MDGFFYILFEYEFYYISVTLTLVGKARMRSEGKEDGCSSSVSSEFFSSNEQYCSWVSEWVSE